MILISAGQEITLASYWIDGSRGKLLLDGEGVLGPDPGRLPPGEIVTRLIDSQQVITQLSQTIQWENSPWYPNGDSTVHILDRVGRKLRDGKPAVAYRELKSVSREEMDVEQLAEWHRLNASVLDVFSKIDRVHVQPSKQQLARAFEISNESSSVRIRSLIDRAERRLREGRISQDPEVRRNESNGALKDARSALNLALKKGDQATRLYVIGRDSKGYRRTRLEIKHIGGYRICARSKWRFRYKLENRVGSREVT